MTFRDLIVVSTGNLRRMKLRTFLTTAGIVIAIAAFVSMLSFGAGNQQYVEGEFNKLGLFSTIQVYSQKESKDSLPPPKLDVPALDRLAAIPGVNLVYPYDAFAVEARVGDSVFSSRAQSLPSAAVRTKLFSHLAAGSAFDSNSARTVIVSDEFLKKAGVPPDSALGRSVVVSVKVSTIDSALGHILVDRGESIVQRLKRVRLDSLLQRRYRTRIVRQEASEIARRFVNGFLNAQGTVRDSLTIGGVRVRSTTGPMRIEPLIVPLATAMKFSSGGISGGPAELFAAMNNGTLFASSGEASAKTFSQVTIDFDPKVPYKAIRDSVEALGYRAFSFAAQFEELQRVFFYFDLALGVVGLIALITASLGIVNTMVMSITERRKEIGILKSLGADEPDIRRLFLVESGVIGLLGTCLGIAFGWLITRIVSAIAQAYMRNQGIPAMELFALPVWLLLLAVGIGVGVSVLAGWYPAARAARVDPVEALRGE
jgi:putative ABC transport system permease protein